MCERREKFETIKKDISHNHNPHNVADVCLHFTIDEEHFIPYGSQKDLMRCLGQVPLLTSFY